MRIRIWAGAGALLALAVAAPAVASAATPLVSVFPYTPVDTFDIYADTTDGRFDVESYVAVFPNSTQYEIQGFAGTSEIGTTTAGAPFHIISNHRAWSPLYRITLDSGPGGPVAVDIGWGDKFGSL